MPATMRGRRAVDRRYKESDSDVDLTPTVVPASATVAVNIGDLL